MSTTKPSIRSIYVGKPDAKDEVLSAGNDAFIKSFILPDNFTANSFLASDNCYITGYKGTGKLRYCYIYKAKQLRKLLLRYPQ